MFNLRWWQWNSLGNETGNKPLKFDLLRVTEHEIDYKIRKPKTRKSKKQWFGYPKVK